MSDAIDGLPFWPLDFEKDGTPASQPAIDQCLADVKSLGITDLFIFSHGWNNDPGDARSLYNRFFHQVALLLKDGTVTKRSPNAKLGIAGVFWPSVLWPDDAASAGVDTVVGGSSGGAVSLGAGAGAAPPPPAVVATPADINAALKQGYSSDAQRALIDELTAMLEEQQPSNDALRAFQKALNALLTSEPTDAPVDRKQPDYAEGSVGRLSDAKWRQLLDVSGDAARSRGVAPSGGAGAAAFANPLKKLWEGAKDVMRVGTYWQMKQRAGIVGREGLGKHVLVPLTGTGVRVHLLGHSFGARLVSFSLSGLPNGADVSPVKSLFLLQGAFSHFAFSDSLPFDATRSGALKGMAARVDGPLLTTHTKKDLAVGVTYPAASIVNQDDASALPNLDPSVRFGAMGHDGAQAVNAASIPLGAPGTAYAFAPGQWINLDANKVIIKGGLPSGAHSDIVYPQTAWAALAAAGIV